MLGAFVTRVLLFQMEMGGPGKGVYRMYDHQKKLSSSKPSRSKPSSSKPSTMPSSYLRMQDKEIHVEEPRNSFSPLSSLGKRVRTRNHDEEYLQEHDHESETRNSFSPPQSHGRRVRFRNQYEEYQQEKDYEGDSVQTGTYMSDDEEDNIGSTSHGMFA